MFLKMKYMRKPFQQLKLQLQFLRKWILIFKVRMSLPHSAHVYNQMSAEKEGLRSKLCKLIIIKT